MNPKGGRLHHALQTRAAVVDYLLDGKTRQLSLHSSTSEAGAILVNAPTLGRGYLLQGPAIAISRTTGINALLVSGLSRHKDQGVEIGVTRIECSRTR
jgi:hypothetical protein